MPRDSSGAYTLPTGNPVIDGTVIESEWANDTMADIAVQMNNVLTRDGLLGPIAPMLFVNGTIPLPGIAFQESPSTGLNRTPPNTLNLVINGVVRQQWTAAGATIQGPVGIVGDFNVTGVINSSGVGPVNIPGPLLLAPGTALLPAYSFASDPNTGVYLGAPDTIGISTGGLVRLAIDPTGIVQIATPTAAVSPALMLTAAAGGFGIDMRGRVGDQLSVLRLLSNDYAQQLFTVQANNASSVIGSTQAIPLAIFTNAIARINISAAGNVTLATPTSGGHAINGDLVVTGTYTVVGSIFAQNYWVGGLTTSAGSFGIAGGNGGSVVTWGSATAGAGSIGFHTNGGAKQVEIGSIGGAVNYWEMYGNVAGSRVTLEARGADTGVGMWFIGKGGGDLLFSTNGGNVLQLMPTVGAGWFQLHGGNNAAPTWPRIGSNASKISIDPAVRFQGNNSTIGDVATLYVQAYNFGISFVNPAPAINRRIAELIFVPPGSGFQARFLNDAGNDARTIWAAFGGVDLGVTDFNLYTGHNDVTLRAISAGTGGGRGWVGVGNNSPLAQLHVNGLGSADPSGNVFDPNVTPALMQATLFLADKGVAAGNGGAILFAGFSDTVPGVHFASIKAYITDASGRTAGELRFNLKNTSADTGSTQALRLTANRGILDSRDLGVGRDAGPTTVAPNFPIGTLIIGQIPGFNGNSLSVINAAVNNITINGMGTGTNTLINFGSWRTIGALSSTSNTSVFIRTA